MSRKTIYFDAFCGYIISAVMENSKITEFNFEKRGVKVLPGNIYKGRVESVLPGMRAAFVNCGLQKNCYLSADDCLPDREKYDISENEEAEMPSLSVGDEIIVQVVKPPSGGKGAKVTANPALVGKSLIYMPERTFIGVSRKISDSELKKNLVFSAKRLLKAGEGVIVRTAAPYAKHKQLEGELGYLRNLYNGIKTASPSAKVGDLLYADFTLPVRVLRDTLSYDIDSIVVGSEELKNMISKIVGLYPPHSRRPVILYDSDADMMDSLGLSEQIVSIISPRADLENGGYIIIERTEALTVIDVNTGSFKGDDSLEHTVYYTNILAAREIARQVRLRNIGGIVVVDFIDMRTEAHKKAIVSELERALSADSAKCVVSPMSRLGLVEFTRKRTGVSPLSLMVKPCRYCRSSGHTMSAEYIIICLRAKLLKAAAEGAAKIRVDMNGEVLEKLSGWKEMLEDIATRTHGAEIFAVPHRTYHEEKLVINTSFDDIPPDAVKLS